MSNQHPAPLDFRSGLTAMPNRQDRRGRSRNPEGQYAILTYDLLRSVAWRALSGSAMKVLLELVTRFNGRNNGDLSLSLDQARETLDIGKATAHAAFAELIDKGLVRKHRTGSWIRGHATTYWITFLNNQKEIRTNDWRNWKSEGKPKKPRRDWGAKKRRLGELIKATAMAKTFPGSEADPIG